MSEVDEQSEEEKEKPEEELIKFEVVNDSLATLCNLLNPQMPADVFLMYLVSLQLISFALPEIRNSKNYSIFRRTAWII